jgi:hypothetical protein
LATPEQGSVARFTFANGYRKEMRIESLQPNEHVQWELHPRHSRVDWNTISFRLEWADKATLLATHPELQDQLSQSLYNYGTVVMFNHSGWRDATPMFAECNYTWALFLSSLKSYVKNGKARPWPNQHRIEP